MMCSVWLMFLILNRQLRQQVCVYTSYIVQCTHAYVLYKYFIFYFIENVRGQMSVQHS